MTSPAHRRLLQDFKKLASDAPEGVSAAPVGDDLFKWCGIVLGPASTPWEGGVWKLDMSFPVEPRGRRRESLPPTCAVFVGRAHGILASSAGCSKRST